MLDIYEIKNKKVLLRVGFDIPNLNDYQRIIDAKNTVDLLLSNNNQVFLITKWGKPRDFDQELSTKKLIFICEKVFDVHVEYINQFIFNEFDAEQTESFLNRILNIDSNLFLLENTHFYNLEKSKNSEERMIVAKSYANLVDCFVDECFISSHRQEATNTEIKHILPYCFGLSYIIEKANLDKIKINPTKPFVCIMGGAKLETKLPLIRKMLETADIVLVGGLISITYIHAKNQLIQNFNKVEIGETAIEVEYLDSAKEDILKYKDKLILPDDLVLANENEKLFAKDIGNKTVENFSKYISIAKTIFWNGPLGQIEVEKYKNGSQKILKQICENQDCFKVIGGGDTSLILNQESYKTIDFISMAGGASLWYLTN
jgi:phosphoglycerate kinase